MTDDALNPYAPPVEEVAATDAQGVWRVEGDYLVVREGTVLPKVDLDGHGKGGPLTPMAMKLPVPLDGKGIALTAVGILPVLGYIIFQAMRGGRVSVLWAMLIGMAGQFLFRGTKVRTAPAHVYGYISVPAIRSITRRAQWRRRLTVALLVPVVVIFPLMAAYPIMTRRYDEVFEIAKWSGGMVGVSLVLLLGVATWGGLEKGWHCTRLRDGWLWIKGLSPGALAGLALRAVGNQPERVKRKVFKIRLDLLPLAFWRQVHGSGLGGRLRTWRFRSQLKKPSEMYAFHWSEREWLTPGEADRELLAAWQAETAGTSLADWSLVYAERFGSPACYDQGNELVFLSPDGCHVAIPMIHREVMARKLKETRELHFRSFTPAGRIIATGTREWVGPQFEGFDFALAKGSPMQVAELHCRRTVGLDLVRMDAEEVRRREQRELQFWYEARVAAGLYSPVEELEFLKS